MRDDADNVVHAFNNCN